MLACLVHHARWGRLLWNTGVDRACRASQSLYRARRVRHLNQRGGPLLFRWPIRCLLLLSCWCELHGLPVVKPLHHYALFCPLGPRATRTSMKAGQGSNIRAFAAISFAPREEPSKQACRARSNFSAVAEFPPRVVDLKSWGCTRLYMFHFSQSS